MNGDLKVIRRTALESLVLLKKEDNLILDEGCNLVVEPGTFTIMIGASSTDIKLEKKTADRKNRLNLLFRCGLSNPLIR